MPTVAKIQRYHSVFDLFTLCVITSFMLLPKQWLQKAAEQGYPAAQYSLGAFHHSIDPYDIRRDGLSVLRANAAHRTQGIDLKQAVQWYTTVL
jgi:hypothetical protein